MMMALNYNRFQIENPGNHTSVYFAFYLLNLQKIFGVFSSLSDVIDSKYVNLVEKELFDGSLHYPEISERLPKSLKDLLNKEFLEAVLTESLDKNPKYLPFAIKSLEMRSWMMNHNFQSKMYYISGGNDLEVPFNVNRDFINQDKEKRFPNTTIVNVGEMLDHANEGKFLILNAQAYYYNQERKLLTSSSIVAKL